MGVFRFPGPQCVTLNAAPRSVGARARAGTSAAGPVGAGGSQSLLSDSDYRYIRDLVGRRFSLEALRVSRASHMREYAKAVAEFGSHSWAAEWQQAIVARLDELIKEAQPARGKTAMKLRKMLEGPIKPAELKKVVAKLLGEERQRQLSGHADDGGDETMTLVSEALQAVAKFHKEGLAKTIERAKQPGNKISDADLSKAAAEVLGAERSKQLLGIADDESSGPPAMELVTEALEVSHNRHLETLKELVEKAKRSGRKVSDAEFKKAIQEVLGTERQRELLGVSDADASGDNAMELVTQALDVSHKRHVASLKSLIAKSKQPGQSVTVAELRKAVVQVAGSERQRQLLGSTDATDDEFSELLTAASKVKTRKRVVPPKSGAAKVTVQIGPISVIRRR